MGAAWVLGGGGEVAGERLEAMRLGEGLALDDVRLQYGKYGKYGENGKNGMCGKCDQIDDCTCES